MISDFFINGTYEGCGTAQALHFAPTDRPQMLHVLCGVWQRKQNGYK